MGHEVFNYGMYSAEDEHQLTYVQNGILAAVLLNSKAADYVITGCGHCFRDRIILAVRKEIFCKTFAAQGAFYQLRIELSENGDHIVVRDFLDFVENFLISLLWYALAGIKSYAVENPLA